MTPAQHKNNPDRTGGTRGPAALALTLPHLLHRASQAADLSLETAMREQALTPRQVTLLDEVGRTPGISQTNLVDRTGIDRSTLGSVIGRLVQRGLVSRVRSRSDCRAVELRLTSKGLQLLGAARPVVERIHLRLLASLPEAERDSFLAGLRYLIERGL
ncbi:MAG: MarR family winged helix-turn-helix transcriptional regulator [Hyphomicrobium sp.]